MWKPVVYEPSADHLTNTIFRLSKHSQGSLVHLWHMKTAARNPVAISGIYAP